MNKQFVIFNLILSLFLSFILVIINNNNFNFLFGILTGTLIGLCCSYLISKIQSIQRYSEVISNQFVLFIPLIYVGFFLIFNLNNVELIISLCIGITLPIILIYLFIEETEILKLKQIVLVLYFWLYSALIVYSTGKLDVNNSIMFLLILNLVPFIILGIFNIKEILLESNSKTKFPFFIQIFIPNTLIVVLYFIIVYYMFNLELRFFYPFLICFVLFLLIYSLETITLKKFYLNLILSILCILIIGGVIVLINRLSGVYGLLLGSLSLLNIILYLPNKKTVYFVDRVLITIAGIFIARSLIQLNLEAINTNFLNVNLIDTYVYSMSVVGLLIPLVILLIVVLSSNHPIISSILLILITLSPLILGIFVPLNAINSFILNLISVTFILNISLAINYYEKYKEVLIVVFNILLLMSLLIIGVFYLSYDFINYINNLDKFWKIIIFNSFTLVFVVFLVKILQVKDKIQNA